MYPEGFTLNKLSLINNPCRRFTGRLKGIPYALFSSKVVMRPNKMKPVMTVLWMVWAQISPACFILALLVSDILQKVIYNSIWYLYAHHFTCFCCALSYPLSFIWFQSPLQPCVVQSTVTLFSLALGKLD